MKTIIIGGVAGGASAAARLRRNDEKAEIILLEKGEYISFANCGLPYYIGGIIQDEDELLLQTPQSFNARFNIDVRTMNEVISINSASNTITVLNHNTGKNYTESYDNLILSPGAVPVIPPILGADMEHVFTLRNIPDTFGIKSYIATHHPKTAAIIGGGYIGIEMAENLKLAGVNTCIIEGSDHVIASLDSDMAHAVHNYLRRKNITLHLSSKAKEITHNKVLLDSGKEVCADLVIMSIGVTPATGFLRDSEITLGERGEIIVDNNMKTSVSNIFAVGDAVSTTNLVSGKKQIIPLASPANKQARIVADIICGKNAVYSSTQGTAIAKVFDMTVAVTGMNEHDLKQNEIEYVKSYSFSASNASYYPGGKMMCVKLLFDTSGVILGAQITGFNGVDKRIDVIACAMRAKMTVYDLQELELAYAPPFSSAKDPVNMAGYVAGNILDKAMKPFYMDEIEKISDDSIILDIRTPMEYLQGHIDNAINIPLDELRDKLDLLDKNVKIYTYCRIGLRGYIAQRILLQEGFDCLNLSGGFMLYENQLIDLNSQATQESDYSYCGMPK